MHLNAWDRAPSVQGSLLRETHVATLWENHFHKTKKKHGSKGKARVQDQIYYKPMKTRIDYYQSHSNWSDITSLRHFQAHILCRFWGLWMYLNYAAQSGRPSHFRDVKRNYTVAVCLLTETTPFLFHFSVLATHSCHTQSVNQHFFTLRCSTTKVFSSTRSHVMLSCDFNAK